ncbi:fatty acid desaturase [Xenorhabdus koppenhoeferi]|uniref:Fatty acid desaturase n=1 Tax=Xenorhabdus koppenhoeferi TaxID=351659 RepID=A0A1I7HHM0_9GAMM|nr:fatty acid desaturase [Xenorhabdus koppenhoeferi]SFU60235.1 Fatty acid desaturase [Xenorhabdus koppenhoeferi]
MSNDKNYFSSHIRESMQILPNIFQKPLTIITGKPIAGQSRIKLSAITEFILTVLIFITSTLGAILVLPYIPGILWFIIIPICWVITVGCLRKIQVTYAHHAVHRCLFNSNKLLNRVMLALCTIIPVSQNGRDYTVDHLGHHNEKNFTTEEDSDAAFLKSLGFIPGMPVSYYKKLLFLTIISPMFHLRFFWSRINSFIFRGSLIESLFAVIWLAILIVPVFFEPVLSILCIYIPYFVIYHISSLLQFLTEHAWLITKHSPKDLDDYARRCWGRFTGEIYPTNSNILSKISWWLKMLFFHAPCRIMILCGDLPVHDWHHLAGELGQSSIYWQNSIYLRQQAVMTQNEKIVLQEIWGIRNMVMNSFISLSKAEV